MNNKKRFDINFYCTYFGLNKYNEDEENKYMELFCDDGINDFIKFVETNVLNSTDNENEIKKNIKFLVRKYSLEASKKINNDLSIIYTSLIDDIVVLHYKNGDINTSSSIFFRYASIIDNYLFRMEKEKISEGYLACICINLMEKNEVAFRHLYNPKTCEIIKSVVNPFNDDDDDDIDE